MQDDTNHLKRLIIDNTQPWDRFWSWREKSIGELGAAQDILKAAGFKVERLQRGQDPPDCEAMLDDKWSGIEVTELVHERSLKRSVKAIQQREAGEVPERPEAYFIWKRDDLLAELGRLLKKKGSKNPKGFAYDQYVLIIHTDETYLDRKSVGSFLEDAIFRAGLITHAFLGLSYDPSCKGYPVFRLNLER